MAFKDPQTPAAPAHSRRPGKPWPARQREWLLLGASFLGLALLFSIWPGLDLAMSGFFYQAPGPGTGAGVGVGVGKFVGNQFAAIGWIHEALPWFGRASALVGLVLLCAQAAQARYSCAGGAAGWRWAC